MPNTVTKLIQFAATESGTDVLTSADLKQYADWLQFKMDSILKKNDFVWTYEIVKVADVQEVDSGDTGYDYAYQFSNRVLDVLSINLDSTSSNGPVPSIDFAISRNIPYDINQFIPGAVSQSRASFLYKNKVLYTQSPLVDALVKIIPTVADAPEDFQEMLQLYLVSVLTRRQDSTNSVAAWGYQKQAQSLEASIVSRGLTPVNPTQGIIASYLRKIFNLSSSV